MPLDTRSPGAGADDASIGTEVWATPGNILADDGSEASVALNGSPQQSHYLTGTSFGFSIPGTATITGIEVTVRRRAASTTVDFRDYSLRLVKGGTIQGDDRADTITEWPAAETAKTYGSTIDLWGLGFTPAEINAANFGVALSVEGVGSMDVETAYVDHITITVHYSEADIPIQWDEFSHGDRLEHPLYVGESHCEWPIAPTLPTTAEPGYTGAYGGWRERPPWEPLYCGESLCAWPVVPSGDAPVAPIEFPPTTWRSPEPGLFTVRDGASPVEFAALEQPADNALAWAFSVIISPEWIVEPGRSEVANYPPALVSALVCTRNGGARYVAYGSGTAALVAFLLTEDGFPLATGGGGTAVLVAAGSGTVQRFVIHRC